MKNIYRLLSGSTFAAIVFCCILLHSGVAFGQNVAVTDVDGYSPHASAMLDVNSTSRGFLLPRLTTAQMNAISAPSVGLLVFNTTANAVYMFNGTTWVSLLSFGVSSLTAPDGSPSNALVVDNNGNIGINQTVPSALLHIKGTGSQPDNYLRLEANTGGYYGNIFYDSQGMKFRTRNAGNGFYFQNSAGKTNFALLDNGWIGIGSSTPQGKFEIQGDASMNADSALFVVKNRNGEPVFVVYEQGVRIYIEDLPGKGGKGGFAIGGRSPSKGALTGDIMLVTPDSVRITLEEQIAKGGKGGFAVGTRTPTKGSATPFMNVTPENYWIGQESGISNTTGKYNVFMGYQSGMANTTGMYNAFVGYQSGMANTIGTANAFFGNLSGKSNVDGGANTYVGTMAGINTIGGSYNTFIGGAAGALFKKGNNNIFIGVYAGGHGDFTSLSQGGDNNILIGNSSGQYLTTGSDNLAIGTSAAIFITTGNSNVAIGKEAGRSLTTGANNLFAGYQAGYSNATSGYNVFLGYQSGYSNNGGQYNAFLGYQAGYSNTTGNYNTFMGYQAGYLNTGASYITAVGYQAGYSLADWQAGTYVGYMAGKYNTGRTNVFVGNSAGYTVSTGEDNVFVGGGAGGDYDNSSSRFTGSRNVFIGKYAGFRYFNGSNNVYLGTSAGSDATGSNNIFIGYSAGQGTAVSNTLIIDNAGGDASSALMYGDFNLNLLRFNANVGINASASSYYGLVVSGGTSSYALFVNGYAYSTIGWITPSDIRLKKNIVPLSGSLGKILQLQGVNFDYRTDEFPDKGFDKGRQIGFVAQQVEPLFPELVREGPDGYKAVDYSKLVPVLVEAIKEQQKQIEQLQQRVEQLEKQSRP